MNNSCLLPLISNLLHSEIKYTPKNEGYVEKKFDPFPNGKKWRFFEDVDPGIIRVEIMGTKVEKMIMPFREFLWDYLTLDDVMEKYANRYIEWKEWNKKVDYVPVKILCDSAPKERPLKSDEFFSSFCMQGEPRDIFNGLSLVMAEYGMGKSSFCINLCKMAVTGNNWGSSKETTERNSLKDAFCKGTTAFPLLFDLNTYKNGVFDEYIENHLHRDYNMNFDFSTLIKLCRSGYFCVVLDAWDQMHHTPYASQVMLDFKSIKKLCNDKGRVLITCRRSFYQKYLKLKNAPNQAEAFEIIQAAALFTLGGFDKKSVKDYLRQALDKTPYAKEINREWLKDCWAQNSDFMEKPFNIRLLASNFETITNVMNLRTEHVRTYNFLEAILKQWGGDNSIRLDKNGYDDPLKDLVFLTLSLGLNRGIEVELYKKKLIEEKKVEEYKAEEYISALRKLEFIEIRDNNGNNNTSIIEFRLAAFQEFLWARYVLEELKERCLLNSTALINAYMLQLEVRAWITEELISNSQDWLRVQLKGDGKAFLGLKYKDKAEIGYCASNVLTLYRDLSKEPYYHKQLLELQSDLRHYCFEEADLRGLDLRGAQFDYSDLLRVDLSYTNLEKASFKAADLSEVIWDEYERILRCAFIENYSSESKSWDASSIAAGTEAGSVLTYSIRNENINTISIEDSTINAIAADATGVYTASQNGWVGYIDANSGELKNAYISTNGLESITAVGRASVYVGAEANGLFRYNWKTGVKHVIDIKESDDEIQNVYDIQNVNYYEINKKQYIACIAGNSQKELFLLELSKINEAKTVAHGKLEKPGYKFNDICFAGKELAFVVSGKGVYSIDVKSLLEMQELDDKDLCNDENLRYDCSGRAVLTWAEEANELFVLERKESILKEITVIHWNRGYQFDCLELEWYYNNRNYSMPADKAEFCVSANARYLAISGDRLAVFERQEDYYELIKEPVEARINVSGADFSFCKGLPSYQINAFKERGATVSE